MNDPLLCVLASVWLIVSILLTMVSPWPPLTLETLVQNNSFQSHGKISSEIFLLGINQLKLRC